MAAGAHIVWTPSSPCPVCRTATDVRLQRALIGLTQTLVWHCLRCHAHWPAMSHDDAAGNG